MNSLSNSTFCEDGTFKSAVLQITAIMKSSLKEKPSI